MGGAELTGGVAGRFLRHRYVRALAWLVVLLAFASGVGGGVYRGLGDQPDWHDFVLESRHAWRERAIEPGTTMFGYLPAAYLALWPFTTWLPQPLGLIAFVALNALAAIASCYILYRWWFARPRRAETFSGSTAGGTRATLSAGGGDRQAGAAANRRYGCATKDTDGDTQAGSLCHRDFVWPLFFFVAHVQHVLQANQFTLWVLLSCVAGLTLLLHGRQWLGGMALGLAVCIKVTPVIFLPYLLLKRQWRAALGMALAIALADVVPSVAAFGLDGAVREHRAWLRRAEWYSNWRNIQEPFLRIRRHEGNCAYSLVLAHWLRPAERARYQVILHGDAPAGEIERARAELKAGEQLFLDPMPRRGESWSLTRAGMPAIPTFRAVRLSAATVWWIWAGTASIAALLLCWYSWRSGPLHPSAMAEGTGEGALKAEASLWLMLTFFLTPMMRDYYLALALPAFVVVWRLVLSAGAPRWTRWVGAVAIAAFYLSVLGLKWKTGVFYGLHLGAAAALGAGCVVAWVAQRRT